MEELNTNLEGIIMQIIAFSGEARSLAFNGLKEARAKNFDKAEAYMEESAEASLKAHKAQTDLLIQEANGEKNDISILLIHAQDHLMTSILAKDLIQEMIGMYKEQFEWKGQ